MQPISLKLENFGPYEDSLIDFSNYYAQSLFLITGKTGAGKTTIFDGMSYALYGSTSGGLRQGKEMRSNFAPLGKKTKVTFTFKQEGKTYQIEREPEQLVKKLRGEGLREQPAGVVLTIFDDNHLEINQLTKQKDVGPFLSELIQLNEQQFSQIVMLPQGEFRRFLIADSDSKEKVLRKLFNTYFYQEVADVLKQKKKGLEADRKKDQQEIALLVSQLSWQDEFVSLISEELSLFDILSIYENQEKQMVAEEQLLENQIKEEQKKLASQVDIITKVKKEIEQFEAFQEVLNQLEQLKTKEQDVATLREKIQLLKKVQQIEPTYYLLKNLLSEKEDSLNKQITLEKEKEALNLHQKEIAAALEKILGQKEDIKEKEKQLLEIESMLPLFKQQEVLKKELTDLEGNKHNYLIEKEQLINQQESVGLELKKSAQSVDAKTEYLEKQIHLEKENRELTQLRSKLSDYDTKVQKQDDLQGKLKITEEDLGQVNEAVEGLIKAVKQAKSNWAKAQIAQLSLDLIEGEACLVCGSTNHPNPYHGEELTKEDMNNLEFALESSEQQLSNMKEQQVTLLNHMKFQQEEIEQLEIVLTSQFSDLKKELEEYGILNDWQINLENQQQLVTTKLNEVLNHLDTIEASKRLFDNLTKEVAEIKEALNNQEQEFRILENQEIKLRTTYEELLTRLPQKEVTFEELVSLQDELQEVVEKWHLGKQENQLSITKVEKELLVIETTLQNELEKMMLLENKIKKEQKIITDFMKQRELSEAGMDILIPEIKNLDELEIKVKTYEQQQYALKKEQEKYQELLKGKEKPDVMPLIEKEQQQLEKIEHIQAELRGLQHILLNNQNKIKEIKLKESSMSEELKILEEITELANVMSGDSDNKLSVERFVLQTYLKRILKRANEKLVVLTNGRYYFELKEESGTYKKKTGLEINIFDDNVGAIRSVNTLSGGESFIAALSLALSLTEIIQEETGGIKIDAMFIDEGFGSLDEDALEMAIRALESIEGENRIIGIISHVRELKERIPQQLQVVSKNGRSSVIERLEFE